MKILKNPFLYLAAITITFIVAFTSKDTQVTQPSGIGDVEYSILDADLFAKTHTGKWVLLDGKPLDKETKLYKLLDTHNVINTLQTVDGYNVLPDARGVFIRGMNNKRAPTTGDPDGERIVGRYQNDIVGPHNHGVTGEAGNGAPQKQEVRDAPEHQNNYVRAPRDPAWGTGIGTETRPKNIALYTYIKVSD